jgi:hypothetical protein
VNTAAQILKPKPALEFDADAHIYRLDGKRLPSVTQIIGAVIPRKFNPGEWYLQRGRAIHQAIHLLSNDSLDWESVDERIKPRLQAFQKFCTETGLWPDDSEISLCSHALRFAGTIDAMMLNEIGACSTLVDFKSSIEPAVILQLGGYSILWRDAGRPAPKRSCAIELREDGQYRCHWFTGPQINRAEQQFKAVLTTYNFMQQNQLLEGRTA